MTSRTRNRNKNWRANIALSATVLAAIAATLAAVIGRGGIPELFSKSGSALAQQSIDGHGNIQIDGDQNEAKIHHTESETNTTNNQNPVTFKNDGDTTNNTSCQGEQTSCSSGNTFFDFKDIPKMKQ
ncbi:MAG: hypothetical protein F6K14_31965 [Symploca sp. SIO2C1]|nr:hypothetical protein [Symploca sp. SIO2C1]